MVVRSNKFKKTIKRYDSDKKTFKVDTEHLQKRQPLFVKIKREEYQKSVQEFIENYPV